MSYVETIRPEIKDWTAKKITSDPKRFGTRQGNSEIIKAYLAEVHKGIKTEELSTEAISASVAVSRSRNKFLEANPQYDLRSKK